MIEKPSTQEIHRKVVGGGIITNRENNTTERIKTRKTEQLIDYIQMD
jgi:hypothetical protein